MLAGLLLAGLMITAGESFRVVALVAIAAHVPVAAVEGVVTGFAASFLHRVEPSVLEPQHV